MTKVLLGRNGSEKIIIVPKVQGFAQLVAYVRSIEPDRRWKFIESWEVAA